MKINRYALLASDFPRSVDSCFIAPGMLRHSLELGSYKKGTPKCRHNDLH